MPSTRQERSNRQPQDKNEPVDQAENRNEVKRRGYYSNSNMKSSFKKTTTGRTNRTHASATTQSTVNSDEFKKPNKKVVKSVNYPKQHYGNRTEERNNNRPPQTQTVMENDPTKSWADYSSSDTDDDGNSDGAYKKNAANSLNRNAGNSYKTNDKKCSSKVKVPWMDQKNKMAPNKNKNTTTMNTTEKLAQFHINNLDKNGKKKLLDKMQNPKNVDCRTGKNPMSREVNFNKQTIHSNDNDNKKGKVLTTNKPAEKTKTPYANKNSNKKDGSQVTLRDTITYSAGEGTKRSKKKASGTDKVFSLREMSSALDEMDDSNISNSKAGKIVDKSKKAKFDTKSKEKKHNGLNAEKKMGNKKIKSSLTDINKNPVKVIDKLKEAKGDKESKGKQNKPKAEKKVGNKEINLTKTEIDKTPENSKKINSKTIKNLEKKSIKNPNTTIFPEHLGSEEVLLRYHKRDPKLIRGRLHIAQQTGLNAPAYVSCDRGSLSQDVCINNCIHRNRAMDGDYVYVELLSKNEPTADAVAEQLIKDMDDSSVPSFDVIDEIDDDDCDSSAHSVSWNDDDMQQKLWNPAVDVCNVKMKHDFLKNDKTQKDQNDRPKGKRRFGTVVYVVPPSSQENIASGSDLLASKPDRKSLIGKVTIENKRLYYFHPKSKFLSKFIVRGDNLAKVVDGNPATLYFAEYVYGSWKKNSFHPPCCNIKNLGKSYDPVNETMALLFEHGIDHGDFNPEVLRDVDDVVRSGMNLPNQKETKSTDLEWKPSSDMLHNRRDYRSTRIFTIDPTDAKDLDDALHIKRLDDDKVEIGVHIADVSHFVKTGTALDAEAENRSTTVYLVDQTIPMLPRPLCEIACSINENVERLAFSCVWQMNLDGTLCKDKSGKEQIWYGKTVIKSCARLDYDTAQNIIEGKVANGEGKIDNELWPKSRRPSGDHTIQDVANDVRLMNRVAIARRKLRFENGALAFGRIKLRFKFREKGRKQRKSNSKLANLPFDCEPYIMKDSNRLVEEYMLLANYLVAQRIIMYAGDLAVLRRHPPPEKGLSEVIDAAKMIGFHIDCSSSRKLHQSLCDFSRDCPDDMLVQCITEMLSMPMKPAKYFATGCVDKEEWGHFALNIPYYTHFTSPIRRYPDILVHRLLQATIEGKKSVSKFPKSKVELHETAKHCNSKRKTAKSAQEQSDRIYLSLYLRHCPIQRALAIVIKVKEKEFIVFIPEIGMRQIICKSENPDLEFTYSKAEESIVLKPTNKGSDWDSLDIKMFTKLHVVCACKQDSPNLKLKVGGPWKD